MGQHAGSVCILGAGLPHGFCVCGDTLPGEAGVRHACTCILWETFTFLYCTLYICTVALLQVYSTNVYVCTVYMWETIHVLYIASTFNVGINDLSQGQLTPYTAQ